MYKFKFTSKHYYRIQIYITAIYFCEIFVIHLYNHICLHLIDKIRYERAH